MSKQLRELQARKAKHVSTMRAITDKAAAEGRDLTDEEIAAFDAEKASADRAAAAISREEALIEAERSAGVFVREGAHITVTENIESDPKRGFKSFGEFAAAVRSGTVLNLTFTAGNAQSLTAPTARISIASTTTVYLVAAAAFGTSTLSTNGTLRARRVR